MDGVAFDNVPFQYIVSPAPKFHTTFGFYAIPYRDDDIKIIVFGSISFPQSIIKECQKSRKFKDFGTLLCVIVAYLSLKSATCRSTVLHDKRQRALVEGIR